MKQMLFTPAQCAITLHPGKRTIRIRTGILSILFLLPIFVSAQSCVPQQKDSLRKVLSRQEGEDKLKTYQQLASHYYAASASDSLAMDTLFTLYDELDAEAG
ncbi:MAG: hypothetical protein LBK96_03855 [Prevotellaceae bacterium]|jgi:hypothetical protein|nr:hypothetical protein [Prevotellaceae bacterium]